MVEVDVIKCRLHKYPIPYEKSLWKYSESSQNISYGYFRMFKKQKYQNELINPLIP